MLRFGQRRQVRVLVEVELAVLDTEHERVPLGLGEVELSGLWLGRVEHHVELALAGLVRRGGGVVRDDDLDSALGLIHARQATAASEHRAAVRVIPCRRSLTPPSGTRPSRPCTEQPPHSSLLRQATYCSSSRTIATTGRCPAASSRTGNRRTTAAPGRCARNSALTCRRARCSPSPGLLPM